MSRNVDVTLTGPIFTDLVYINLKSFSEDVRDAVGDQALANVHTILNRRIKHPTPYYETQLRTTLVADSIVVNDSGVIYGGWLEGTSRRNQATRFKGYHAFRNATQQTTGQIDRLIQPSLRRFLASVS